MTLGQRIQELRKQAGMSQESLGEALGVSRQAVSKWEGDNGIPELDTLIAMSKLFKVTLGQLLGVEGPAPAEEEPTAAMDEEKVEAILRRYVEESRQHEPPKRPVIWPWILAVCCVVAVVVVTIVSVGQVREVKESVNTLWNNVVDIESIVSNVRNQVGGLSDELRGVLEEQSSLLSTFEYEILSFDVEKQTVELKLLATLKTYTAGSKVQFVLDWIETDQTTGELVSDSVTGPKFETTVVIPMNFHLEVGIRVIQEDGTIHEQQVETIYGGMHPEEFKVVSYGRGSWTMPEDGRYGYQVDMSSEWPEQIYPVGAVMVILLNGEEVYREEVPFTAPAEGKYQIQGDIRLEPYRETDDLQAWCYVTDNFGRVEEFQMPINMNEAEVHAW